MRAPRARRRARALLGACWAWAREGELGGACIRVASNGGPVGAGWGEELGRGQAEGRWLGEEAAVRGSREWGGHADAGGVGFCNRG